MTGTIAPPAKAVNLALTDVASRIEDYKQGLRYYMSLVETGKFDRLVFAENSGYGTKDLLPIVEDAKMAEKVELLSFSDNDDADKLDRLFLESKLMRTAVKNSEMLNRFPDAVIWKVTGRYRVKNIAEIAKRAVPTAGLWLHCKNYPVRHVDFAVFGVLAKYSAAFFDILLNEPRIKTGGEGAVRELYDEGAFDSMHPVPRLPLIPSYSGKRGVDGGSFDSPKARMKHRIRTIANRVAPGMWL